MKNEINWNQFFDELDSLNDPEKKINTTEEISSEQEPVEEVEPNTINWDQFFNKLEQEEKQTEDQTPDQTPDETVDEPIVADEVTQNLPKNKINVSNPWLRDEANILPDSFAEEGETVDPALLEEIEDPYTNINKATKEDPDSWDIINAGRIETREDKRINKYVRGLEELDTIASDILEFKNNPTSNEAMEAKRNSYNKRMGGRDLIDTVFQSIFGVDESEPTDTWTDQDSKNYILQEFNAHPSILASPEIANMSSTKLVEMIIDDSLENLDFASKAKRQVQEDVPYSDSVKNMFAQENFGDTFDAFMEDPINIIKQIGLRSAAGSAQALAIAAPGFLAGPLVLPAGFLGSYSVENPSAIVNGLQEAGVDLTDENSIAAFLSDEKAVTDLYNFASKRAAIIGAADAATLGLLTKFFSPATNTLKGAFPGIRIGNKTAMAENLVIGTGLQVAGGAGGETLAQIATVDGPLSYPDIVAEGVGEFITGPIDVAVVSGAMYLDGKNKTKAYFDANGKIRFTNSKVPKNGTEMKRNEDGTFQVDSMPSGTVIVDEQGNPVSFIPDEDVNKTDQPTKDDDVIEGDSVVIDEDAPTLPSPDTDVDIDVDTDTDTDVVTEETDTDVTPETTTEEKVTTKRFKINEGDYPINKLTIGDDVRYYQKQEDVGFGATGAAYWIRVDEGGNPVDAETGKLLGKEDPRGYSASATNQQSLVKIKQEMLDNYNKVQKVGVTERFNQLKAERSENPPNKILANKGYPHKDSLVDIGMRLITLERYDTLEGVDPVTYFKTEDQLKEMNESELESYLDAKIEQRRKQDKNNAIINGIENRYKAFLKAREQSIKEGKSIAPRWQDMIDDTVNVEPSPELDLMQAPETQKQIADRNKIADIIDESEKGLDIEPMSRSSSAPPGVNYVPLLRSIPNVLPIDAKGSRTAEIGQQLKNPINRTKILRPLLKALDIPLFQGSINNAIRASKSVMGYYRRGTDVIRIRYNNDLEVVAHEIAHLIDYKNPEIAKFYRKNNFPKEMELLINEATAKALEAFGGKKTDASFNNEEEIEMVQPVSVKEQTSPKAEITAVSYTTDPTLRLKEGFAEFHRLYMTQPNKAKELTPNIYNWYENWLNGKGKLGKEIRKASKGMQQWYNQDAVSQFRSKIGDEGSVNNYFWKNPADNIRMYTIDDLQGIKSLMIKSGFVQNVETGKKEIADPYEIARLTRGSAGIVEGSFVRGVPTYKITSRKIIGLDGKEQIKQVKSIIFEGKPLIPILNEAQTNSKIRGNHLQLFYDYMYAVSSMELEAQGRQNRFTKSEMSAVIDLVEKNHPQMKKAFQEYLEWNKGIVKFAIDGGLLSPKDVSKWQRAMYVPMYNVGTAGPVVSRKRLDNGKVNIKRLFGSPENLLPAGENIIGNARMLITETLINEAKIEIINALKESQKFQGVEPLIKQTKQISVSKQQIDRLVQDLVAEALQQEVLDTDISNYKEALSDILDDQFPDFVKFLSFGNAVKGKNIVQVMFNGKPKEFEVIDTNLYRSLQMLKRDPQDIILNTFSFVRRVGQDTITLMPKFLLNSLFRETFGGWVTSYYGQIPFINSLGGLYSIMRNDPMYQEFLANGGGYSSYINGDIALQRRLYQMTPKSQFSRIITSPADAFVTIEKIANAIELATKVAEFKAGRKKGADPRLATFRGRETGADFAMQGNTQNAFGYTFNWVSRTIMFFQATLTGLDRIFRGLFTEENRASVATKAGTVSLVAGGVVLHNMLNYRDEYDDLEDWEKISYVHVFYRNPATGKVESVRFPKLYDLGIVMNIGEGFVANAVKVLEEDQTLSEGAKNYLIESLATVFDATIGSLPLMPQVAKPFIQQSANYDFFTQAPIETMSQQSQKPSIRQGPNTSPLLAAITDKIAGTPLDDNSVGNYIGSAPRLEKIIKDLFHTAGEMALRLADDAYYAANPDIARKKQKPWKDVLFTDYVREAGEQPYSADITRFFDLITEGQELKRSIDRSKIINKPESQLLYEKEFFEKGFANRVEDNIGREMSFYQLLVQGNRRNAKFNKAMDAIRYDENLTPDQIEQSLQIIMQAKNQNMEDIVEEFDAAEKLRKNKKVKDDFFE